MSGLLSRGGRLLSRLHRRAEALDQACLRAHGHPHDYAIRQELLSALEWEASLHPRLTPLVIREVFKEVHDYSTDLLIRIQSADDPTALAHPIAEIPSLRRRLAKLLQTLAARHRGAVGG